MTAQAEGMAPGLTLWGNARKLAEDENPRGLNFAQFEDVRLDPGLYGISASSLPKYDTAFKPG